MNSLWVDLAIPIIITIVTIVSNFMISMTSVLYFFVRELKEDLKNFLIGAKTIDEAIELIVNKSNEEKQEFIIEIVKGINVLNKIKAQAYSWGGDLSLLSVTLGVTILAISLNHKGHFPFFNICETLIGINYLFIAIIILMAYYGIYCITTVFFHRHVHKITSHEGFDFPEIFSDDWYHLNKYFLSSFALGSFALFSILFIMLYQTV